MPLCERECRIVGVGAAGKGVKSATHADVRRREGAPAVMAAEQSEVLCVAEPVRDLRDCGDRGRCIAFRAGLNAALGLGEDDPCARGLAEAEILAREADRGRDVRCSRKTHEF